MVTTGPVCPIAWACSALEWAEEVVVVVVVEVEQQEVVAVVVVVVGCQSTPGQGFSGVSAVCHRLQQNIC